MKDDICDHFEVTQSIVAPIMMVSPEQALCNTLGVPFQNFRNLINLNLLSQNTENSFYVYALSNGDHTQIGVCAAVSVEDYRQGVIKRHEDTRKERMKKYDPEASRFISLKTYYINFNSMILFIASMHGSNNGNVS
jgi:uncharacterized protein (DUF1015 family)